MFGGWREGDGEWKLVVEKMERTKTDQECISLWHILKLCSLHWGIRKGGGAVSYDR
jgi:hypothetical protein